MLKWYLKDALVARKIQIDFGVIVTGVATRTGYAALTMERLQDSVTE